MIELLPAEVRALRTETGLVLSSPVEPGAPARCIGDWLVRWARERPDAAFLAERDRDGGWAELRYGQALAAVESIASYLLEHGAAPDRPVMILSDNSVAAALLSLAAMHAGVPVAPVSPAYSLQSTSFDRLRAVTGQLRPGFVFADEPQRFAPALAAIDGLATGAVRIDGIAPLFGTPRSPALDRAFAAIAPWRRAGRS
jgi:feruloyl-CoA synthase